MEQYAIWQRTFSPQGDNFDPQRSYLKEAFLEFRGQVKLLVGEIAGLLPDLTVHDISHLDALWRVADQIAGSKYPINPAEAFVLGGAFLLHDAAHVLAAYSNRLQGVKESVEWQDLIAQRFFGIDPRPGSEEEKAALFQVLRHLHAAQAHKLPTMSWKLPGSNEKLHLIPNFTLREYYGDLIGEIAESHHWPAYKVAEHFDKRHLGPPSHLSPAMWEVDALKIAFLLRTADAAHVDALRAPWFLFALRQPQGISESHWRFQAKLGQPVLTSSGELRLSSGSPFSIAERNSWWLAYDTAKMIDRELRDAQLMLREYSRPQFAANGVAHIATPQSFSTAVRTSDWEPVHVELTIKNVSKILENFGGEKLYGDHPERALRELIQNGADAIRASRTLKHLGFQEGEIEVALSEERGQLWLHITDQGIGMSRYVLTEVLTDFGNSLWSSEAVRSELPGLTSGGFKSVGQFGIGFYSIFMLGKHVIVNTRRFRRTPDDGSDQWILEFENGISNRPTLRKPNRHEELSRSGTRVSISIAEETLKKLVNADVDIWRVDGLSEFGSTERGNEEESEVIDFSLVVANLCPTLDVTIVTKVGSQLARRAVFPDDWKIMSEHALQDRVNFRDKWVLSKSSLLDLIEPTSGELVGRVGYHRYANAHTTHNGIRNGTLPQTVGVLFAHNNLDLARLDARPTASPAAWSDWAQRFLDPVIHRDFNMMLTLHPLSSQTDLPVYELDNEYLTEADLRDHLATVTEIRIHSGWPVHDSSDDMASTRFELHFEADRDIIFHFRGRSELAEELGFPQINYLARLDSLIQGAWGGTGTRSMENMVVGDVENIEIYRDVYVYKRQQS